ncbi:MAG: hypothetical protein KatS3mg082_2008 [Nitrospiraceae bacterium]|nr:MAG: hypothetical protein KatS3mg082_2008 [Nitrospiraceae bacterium]
MVAAIEIYNKPDFRYRAESFVILATNAWELLLKAKGLVDHDNKLTSLYVRQGRGPRRKRVKKTTAGNPFTHGIDYLAAKTRERGVLDENAYRNLKLLTELRDSAVHFYHRDPTFAENLQEIGAAAVKNFCTAAMDWFHHDLSRFNFYLMPLAFVPPPRCPNALPLRSAEKRFLQFVGEVSQGREGPASGYSVVVDVEVRFVRGKAAEAIPVRLTTDPNAQPVRLSEEQIRQRYRWDYKELTEKCRARYPDFKQDKKYHRIRKKLESDTRYAHVRRLDPDNPRSTKKTFYDPNILNELDRRYSRKRR